MNKEIIKFEKDKTYTYEEIKEIFDKCTAELIGLDEEKKDLLRKTGKSEEEIDKFCFSQFLSNMLFVVEISKKMFEE